MVGVGAQGWAERCEVDETRAGAGLPYTVGFAMSVTKQLACVLAVIGAAACKMDPAVEDRPVVLYSLRSCPVSQSEAYSVIYGNGDFDDAQSAVSSLYLRDVGSTLAELPPQTRSVIVDVSQPARTVDWRGTAEVPASGPVNVLVWPGSETCPMTRNVEPRVDATFGTFGRHIMVVGGSLAGQVPHTFVGDLSTGILESLEFGIGTRRSRASITAFRTSADQDPSPALVAGGEDPDTHTPISTAELYVPKPGAPGDLGDFDAARIDLSGPRTRHGAVVLASGETLLVGGIGPLGAPLATMEIVSPATRRYRTSGVALLAVPRRDPTVLRLASGEILVAGGFDRTGTAVATLEWFSADASRPTKRPVDLVTGRERAFVPLEGGGALAVIIPPEGTLDFKTVWVISADGTLEPGLPIDPATLGKVRLFQGATGAPVLWTGTRWLRWQPWFAAFEAISDAPVTGSTNPPRSAGPSGTAIANGDNGLALWLDTIVEGQLFVTGYRFDTRSRFGAVKNPLLGDSTLGLVPDRIANTPGSSIAFDPVTGLSLGLGASAFVADVTYADVTVELEAKGGTAVVLRQDDGSELSVGGAECPYASAPQSRLRVERRGRNVRYSIDGGGERDCTSLLTDGTRVRIGLRGADNAPSVSRNLRITRR
ncbi:MAG: Rhs family protein [Labilithrix sp.]|nr:Rhs family protein [Labilithrix sp.]